MRDFYNILGLYPTCSLDEIKAAYRKLSKKLHPDLNQGDEYFENKFRDIKEAFETLRDPEKRQIYNEQLNKFKADKRDSEPGRKRSASQSYGHSSYKQDSPPPGAKSGKIRKKGPGVGLSITLIVLTLIAGIYLFSWLIASSHKKQLAYTATRITPQAVHKKHRHKHTPKIVIAATNDKKTFDTAKVVAVKPEVMNPLPFKPRPIKPAVTVQPEPLRPLIAKNRPDSDSAHSDYLYTTYVHPNVTGIVQMRDHDRFNSDIIASIPANARVFVLERGTTYYRVFYNNSIGFVPKWSLHQK